MQSAGNYSCASRVSEAAHIETDATTPAPLSSSITMLCVSSGVTSLMLNAKSDYSPQKMKSNEQSINKSINKSIRKSIDKANEITNHKKKGFETKQC